MKGFKKDGKFRPTESRTKSSLSKSDIDNAHTEADMSALLLKSIKSTPEYKRGDVRVINNLGLERNKESLEHKHGFDIQGNHAKCKTCNWVYSKDDEEEWEGLQEHESDHKEHGAGFIRMKDQPNIRNKGSFDEQKEDALKKVKAKGLVITERHEEATEKDEEDFDYFEVEIGEKETLDAVDGKSTALEMMDKITGISEDERLRFDITLDNKLAELSDAGKIEVEAGTNIWKRVN